MNLLHLRTIIGYFKSKSIARHGWFWYAELFYGNNKIAALAAIPIIVAVTGIVVRGFQFDTWAWTEFYADSYYYLAFAKSAAQGDFFTYAGVSPTSGVQPLNWLHMTATYALSGGNQSLMYPILFATYALAFLVTIWAVLYTVRLLGGGVNLLLFAVFAMTYGNYVFNVNDIPIKIPLIFTGFVSLMAIWLLITSLALMVAAGVRNLKSSSAEGWILIAIASVIAVGSRLDYLFVVFPFVVVVAWRSATLLRWQRVVLAGAAPFAAGVWALILLVATGLPVPTSGAVKSTLSHAIDLGANEGLRFLAENTQRSVIEIHTLVALAGTLGCAVLLILAVRSGSSRNSPIVQVFGALLFGMLVLFSYHMVFTYKHDVGDWYFKPYRVIFLMIGLFVLGTIPLIRNLLSSPIVTRGSTTVAVLVVGLIVVSHLSAPAAASGSFKRSELVRDIAVQLETAVDLDATFYDDTDGAFGWFSDYTAYHKLGMANNPDYVDTGRKLRSSGRNEQIEIFARYIDEKSIDYFVSTRGGSISILAETCWVNLPKIAYSERKVGGQFSNAYVARTGDWLAYLKCVAPTGF
jgi:hypothetical protein